MSARGDVGIAPYIPLIMEKARPCRSCFSLSKNHLARERPRLPCVKGAVRLRIKRNLTEGLSQFNVSFPPKAGANS